MSNSPTSTELNASRYTLSVSALQLYWMSVVVWLSKVKVKVPPVGEPPNAIVWTSLVGSVASWVVDTRIVAPLSSAPLPVMDGTLVPAKFWMNSTVHGPPAAPVTATSPAAMFDSASSAVSSVLAEAS